MARTRDFEPEPYEDESNLKEPTTSRTKERTRDVANQRERWKSTKAKRERYANQRSHSTLTFRFKVEVGEQKLMENQMGRRINFEPVDDFKPNEKPNGETKLCETLAITRSTIVLL
ncbi:unnamed protein product [Camellia sinensis]